VLRDAYSGILAGPEEDIVLLRAAGRELASELLRLLENR
jgi:hypothetical protein